VRIFVQGNLRRLSSFSIINRQVIRGLRRGGHQVCVFRSDDRSSARANPAPADVYIFNGHPWDARSAPGRLNVFVLSYEYHSADRDVRMLVPRLNAAFDLVLVPAEFVKPALKSAGLRVPIEVIPWGHDRTEFHPSTVRVALPTSKRFVFLYVGAANERKGIDVLLDAYLTEFSADDDVALVIKEGPRHATYEPWLQRVERRYLGTHRRGGAEVHWMRTPSASVAGYFAAADVGVFPHRGEGFGLAVLECIASGRRVIVTAGAGPAAFCTGRNSWPIRSRRVRRHGRLALDPDARHLRSLLRAAYACGKPTRREAIAVSRTVRHWVWDHSVKRLDAVLRQHLAGVDTAERTHAHEIPAAAKARTQGRAPSVVYSFYSRGVTSWKKLCTEIDRALRERFDSNGGLPRNARRSEPQSAACGHAGSKIHSLLETGCPQPAFFGHARYQLFTYCDRFDVREVDIFVGQSEHCLEALLKVSRINSHALKIVHQECTVLGDRMAIVNRERALCGLEPIAVTPMDFWRNRRENDLADRFIVSSSVARACFLQNGFDPSTIHVIPYGIRRGEFHFRGKAARTRFLFVGTDPFRKGIRLLLAAWERAALRDAELVCCTDLEVLKSKLLLAYLVRNPSITVRPLSSHRAFQAQYREIDCQVLPSLEDTFSVAVADGMGVGKPAIVSTATGVKDLIEHGVSGHIVGAGDVEALAESLRYFAADRRRLRTMGEAAHETARRYTWHRFRQNVGDLVASLWAAQ
jgi:glycosyltransferase involved in cell wall biosynthesis